MSLKKGKTSSNTLIDLKERNNIYSNNKVENLGLGVSYGTWSQ